MAGTDRAKLVDVVIIGAGISGIGAAIRLRQAGFHDVVVLEKADSIGGTWRDNTYPGCACDVPSALYSYAFAQKRDWSRVFAQQAEIAAYVRETAERHGVVPLVRFGEGVEEARWIEAERRWSVRTSKRSYKARFVVSCVGYLHEPIVPEIPGLAAFPGTVFHSSRWDHGHDLRGRRVAVIGTGASAIQFVPRIQPLAKRLHLFQRTPQWILPKPDAALGPLSRAMLRLPGAMSAARRALHLPLEWLGVAFLHPERMKAVQSAAFLHMQWSVRDPELRSKLTPSYVLGCKRLLLSNDYYPAVVKPNVEVLATGVERVSGRAVVGSQGEAREVDTIILGTGFRVTDPPMAARVHGSDGRSLAEVWAGSPEGYRGTSTAGFPNVFGVLGLNLAIGHNSAFLVIEAQLDPTASGLLLRAVRGGLDPIVALSGLAPRGRADMTGLRRLVRAAVGDQFWPSHPGLRIMVVDTRTGQRVALGRADVPRVPIVDAVCASYAIPGWCPPVASDGVTYVDGGVASPTSADLLVGADVAEAIVLAPMASGELAAEAARMPFVEKALLRRMTRLVNAEVRALEHAGVRVARLTPAPEDLAAFGRNLMSGRRRRLVFETATRTAKDAVADALLDFRRAGEPASARVADVAAYT